MNRMPLTNSWHESSGGIAAFYRALVPTSSKISDSTPYMIWERYCA
jgi:hypothetical protein